tara:strand:- start:2416 stop:2874 length:459 start_codon:yes stop_codon:yes gene_type:complete
MKPTEDYIDSIILKETKKYLEEIRALDPELYKQVLQKIGARAKGAYEKGYVPFTEPHRTAFRKEISDSSTWEVLIMVMGDPNGREAPLQDWPAGEGDRKIVQQFLSHHGADLDSPWSTVQELALKEMEKYRKRQQLAEIIKEEVVKYLKENE